MDEEFFIIASKSTGNLYGEIARDPMLVDYNYVVSVKNLTTGKTVTLRRYKTYNGAMRFFNRLFTEA